MKKNWIIGAMVLMAVAFAACSEEEKTLPEGGEEEAEEAVVELDDVMATSPSKGFYVANEGTYTDQTGGGSPKVYGSVNYFGYNNPIDYRAYAKVNMASLGQVTHFATIFGENIYFVSRAAGTALVIADASSLQKRGEIVLETENSEVARMFVGVNDKLGYLSHTKGIYKVDLTTMTRGDKIESVVDQEIGAMCSTGKYVFAVARDKVYVINVSTSSVEKTFDGAFWTLTRSKDGNIWVAAKTEFLKINPVTLVSEKVAYPAGLPVEEDSNANLNLPENIDLWNTWHAGSLCAATQNNVLYWANKDKVSIIKYNIDTKEAKVVYTLGEVTDDGDNYKLFLYRGAGMRIDPLTDNLIVVAVGKGAGFKVAVTRIYTVKAEGTQDGRAIEVRGGNKTYDSYNAGENYMWRPAMPFFEDANLPQILLKKITISVGKKVQIDLKTKIVDADNTAASILREVTFEEGNDLLTYTLADDGMLTLIAGTKTGSTTCKITAISNGKCVEKTVEVIVASDKK